MKKLILNTLALIVALNVGCTRVDRSEPINTRKSGDKTKNTDREDGGKQHPPGVSQGTSSGGGGKAVVCRDKNNKIKSVELLDLYEARTLYDRKIEKSKKNVDEIVSEAIKRLDSAKISERPMNWCGGDCTLGGELNYRYEDLKDRVKILDDTTLVPTNDAQETSYPKDCHIEQVADYNKSGMVVFDKTLFSLMDNVNQAALWVHEILYSYLRDEQLETNSLVTRRAIGYVFSGETMPRNLPDFKLLADANKTILYCSTKSPSENSENEKASDSAMQVQAYAIETEGNPKLDETHCLEIYFTQLGRLNFGKMTYRDCQYNSDEQEQPVGFYGFPFTPQKESGLVFPSYINGGTGKGSQLEETDNSEPLLYPEFKIEIKNEFSNGEFNVGVALTDENKNTQSADLNCTYMTPNPKRNEPEESIYQASEEMKTNYSNETPKGLTCKLIEESGNIKPKDKFEKLNFVQISDEVYFFKSEEIRTSSETEDSKGHVEEMVSGKVTKEYWYHTVNEEPILISSSKNFQIYGDLNGIDSLSKLSYTLDYTQTVLTKAPEQNGVYEMTLTRPYRVSDEPVRIRCSAFEN